ncbi:MAG TPA: GGDEF domain-containing protein [Azospirillaceae bacterium]|nr:GGDEF domain-containing protein [Azospirillaceae bacterium]
MPFSKPSQAITALAASLTLEPLRPMVRTMLHPGLGGLFQAWRTGSPDRDDIANRDLGLLRHRFAEFLDNLIIIDVAGPQFTYRHYGRTFVDAFNVDLEGLTIDYVPEDILPNDHRQFLEFEYAWVNRNRRPVWRAYTASFDGVERTWQRLILPLADDRLVVGAYECATPVPAPGDESGHLLTLVLDAVPVWLDDDGGIGGLVVRFRDLAESRHRERELEQLATVDPLTGTTNRREFLRLAEAEVQRASRTGRPLALLMLDIDHFKQINDRFGHPAGDEALRRFADTCRGTLRSADVFGRCGGEEFAIITPDTDAAGAAVLAERLRRHVAASTIDLPGGPLRMTVSTGIAGLSGHDTLDTLTHRADRALYRAKHAGRNRVIVCGEG